jgi:hypothetical protein
MDTPAKLSPLPPGFEKTVVLAKQAHVHPRTLRRALPNADTFVWGGYSYHRTADAQRAIAGRIERRNPERTPRQSSRAPK